MPWREIEGDMTPPRHPNPLLSWSSRLTPPLKCLISRDVSPAYKLLKPTTKNGKDSALCIQQS